jgi:hypothetical protein
MGEEKEMGIDGLETGAGVCCVTYPSPSGERRKPRMTDGQRIATRAQAFRSSSVVSRAWISPLQEDTDFHDLPQTPIRGG